MIAISPDLQLILSSGFWHGAMVFLRVSSLVSLLPAFGDHSVPTRVKLGLAIAFTLIVAPAVTVIPPPSDILTLTGVSVSEVGIGLFLGFGIRMFVLVLQTAGSIAAQSTSLSQILGGAGVDELDGETTTSVGGGGVGEMSAVARSGDDGCLSIVLEDCGQSSRRPRVDDEESGVRVGIDPIGSA